MTIKELKQKTFDEAIIELLNEKNTLTDYETLQNFAITNIKEDRLFLAIHILKSLQNNHAIYFDYDYFMGTLDTPTPIENLSDLLDYCEKGD